MGARILVVEDQFLISQSLCDCVEALGASVAAVVANAGEAITRIEQDGIDGVLLDLRLQSGSGADVARVLEARDIPYILVTGYARETLPGHLKSAPYVGKPWLECDLIQLVERTFRAKPGTTEPCV